MRISFTRGNTEAIAKLLHARWPSRSRRAKARDALSRAVKHWNFAYAVHADKYLVWKLLRLTGLHDKRHPRNYNVVCLGSEFHVDPRFRRWAINHKLLQLGEVVSVPCYTEVKSPAKTTLPIRRQIRSGWRLLFQ